MRNRTRWPTSGRGPPPRTSLSIMGRRQRRQRRCTTLRSGAVALAILGRRRMRGVRRQPRRRLPSLSSHSDVPLYIEDLNHHEESVWRHSSLFARRWPPQNLDLQQPQGFDLLHRTTRKAIYLRQPLGHRLLQTCLGPTFAMAPRSAGGWANFCSARRSRPSSRRGASVFIHQGS